MRSNRPTRRRNLVPDRRNCHHLLSSDCAPKGQHIILEPGHDGHRLQYVKLLAEELRRRDELGVLVTTYGCRASREYAVHLESLVARGDLGLMLVAEPEGGPTDFRGLRRLCRLAARAAADRGAVVTLPDGDRFLLPLLTLVPRPRANVLLMRAWPFASDRRSRAVFVVKRIVASVLRSTGRVQIVCLQNPLDPIPIHIRHDRIAHDPIPRLQFTGTRDEAREVIGLPTERLIVGVIGNLSEHKAIDLVLAAWAQVCANARKPPLLVLAGRTSASIRSLLQEPSIVRLIADDSIRIREGYMSDRDLDALLVAMNVVLLPYPFEASSGTLNRVVQTDTAVIAAGSQTIARAVGRNGLGISCSLTVDGLARAIETVMVDGFTRGTPYQPGRNDPERAWAQALLGRTTSA